MNTAEAKRSRGRPSNFDHDEALEKALNIFWMRGYEGASMAELTEALGVNRPSIYAAFGNKEELFKKALAKYIAGPVSYVNEAFNQATAKQAVEMFLTKSVEFLSNPATPNGCMVVQGALTCGIGAELIQQELAMQRHGYENALKKKLAQAQAEGDFPAVYSTSAFAKYIATLHQGLSIQSTSGASKEELMAVVEIVMQSWPS